MTVCSGPEDGLRCRQGVKPPLNLKTSIKGEVNAMMKDER